MAQMDFASSYLKTLRGGFLGFASVDTVYTEGTAGDWEAAVRRAYAKIDVVYDHFSAWPFQLIKGRLKVVFQTTLMLTNVRLLKNEYVQRPQKKVLRSSEK